MLDRKSVSRRTFLRGAAALVGTIASSTLVGCEGGHGHAKGWILATAASSAGE